MCPNYKNKQVFNEFNEIITALGGTAMSEEEFKDSALRNQRTGIEYQAMEAAYKIWDYNNGNAIDYAPNGKPSLLFETFLSLNNGDRIAAIRAKSKVYSNQFKNWFGDWITNPSEASKVVDENGEPLVVYHGSNKQFNTFELSHFGETDTGNLGKGFYLTSDKTSAFQYGENVYELFVNARSILNTDEHDILDYLYLGAKSIEDVKALLQERIALYESKFQSSLNKQMTELYKSLLPKISKERFEVINKTYDIKMSGNLFDEQLGEFVIPNPNQIKSATDNVGTFSNTDNNIYYNISEVLQKYDNPFAKMDQIEVFGQDIVQKLLNGETVSSQQLIQNAMSDKSMFRGINKQLSEILVLHDVPVVLSNELGFGILASTITDKNGGSVIAINKEWINKVSKNYFGETLLHEVIHAVTANALSNPVTKEQKEFKSATENLYNTMRNKIGNNLHYLINSDICTHALSNIQEFAAVFMTSETARNAFYTLAQELDATNANTVVGKFKNFINKATKLLANKTVFKSNVEKLQQYQDYTYQYLTNQQPIQKGNIASNSELIQVYKSIDNSIIENESVIDRMIALNRSSGAMQENHIIIDAQLKGFVFHKKQTGQSGYDDIRNSIQSGILALRASKLEEHTKQTMISSLQTQLDMFNNPQISTFQAITNLVRTMVPRIFTAIDEIKHIDSLDLVDADNANYMYYMHDNIGMYDTITQSLLQTLENEEECKRLISNNNELSDTAISNEEVQDVQNTVKEVISTVHTAKAILKNILNRASLNTLQQEMEKAGALEGIELLHKINTDDSMIEDDINWFELHFGPADASSNEVIRAVSHLISKANDKVEDKLIKKAVKLLKLQNALKNKKDVLKLYEFVKGKATGYLVRDLNFGAFEQAYRKKMKEINAKFGLPSDNTQAPSDPEKRIQWNKERNTWLNEHCERKYTEKYYNAWAKISSDTKDKLDGINGSIKAILEQYNVVDENGHYHYEKVKNASSQDWETLQRLWVAKKLLSSDYDEFGNPKQDSELRIAKELQQLYTDLYGNEYKERQKNIHKWQEARNAIIEECGGQQQYELWKDGKPNAFDYKKLDDWDSVNSKVVFKKNNEGKTIVFDRIEQEMQAVKINYGEEYEKLKSQAAELLRPYYDLAGEVNDEFLPDAVKNLLNNVIYKRMAEIRKERVKTIPGYAELQKRYAELFQQYIKLVDTRYYKRIQDQIAQEMFEQIDTFDQEMFTLMLAEHGYLQEFDGFFDVIPFKWLQRLQAKNFDEFMEIVPNNGWQEQEEDQSLLNDKFDSKYNTTMVPKRSKYDNSKAYAAVSDPNSKLGALYQEVLSTMHESNELQTNRNWTNDYRLPQITARLHERLSRAPYFKKLKVFAKWFAESIGFTKWAETDTKLKDFSTETDVETPEGDTLQQNYVRISGTHPDGRAYSSMPQYYTRRLENPEDISYELVDMILSYYKMSVNYSEKLAIRDKCEMLVDFIKNRAYNDSWVGNPAKKAKQLYSEIKGRNYVEDSNVYKQMRSLLDMALYGKVKKSFNTKYFSLSIAFNAVRQYTSAVNLGWNKKVAVVGFLTAMHAHFLNGILGKEYSFNNVLYAGWETIKNVLKLAPLNQSSLSDNKLQCILEQFGIANQLERKLTNTNRGAFRKFVSNNHTFGYLATIDYLTKSQITIACLKDYKLIDGNIYSSLDIKYLQYDQQKYKYLMTKYKSAKSLYDIIKIENNQITVPSQYKQVWENNYSRIKAKCVKHSERADGVATGLQRASIQQSWIGMFMMIHRQYLPLMLQERWGQNVYDYDMQEYKGGTFRITLQYLRELAYNTLIPGMIGTGAFGYVFLGPWGIALSGVAAAMRVYGKSKGKNKSFKQINKEFFKNFKDQKSTIKSVENEFAVKQVMYENLMYSIMSLLVVQPLCTWADDDKDSLLLQSIAYWLRASQFEITGPYNLEDLMSTIKSPTASTSVLDKINSFTHSTTDYMLENLLYNLSLIDEEPNDVVGKNSAYTGWNKVQKSVMQLTPYHNEYEQDSATGVKQKHNYLARRQMHIKKGKDFNIYEWLRDVFVK